MRVTFLKSTIATALLVAVAPAMAANINFTEGTTETVTATPDANFEGGVTCSSLIEYGTCDGRFISNTPNASGTSWAYMLEPGNSEWISDIIKAVFERDTVSGGMHIVVEFFSDGVNLADPGTAGGTENNLGTVSSPALGPGPVGGISGGLIEDGTVQGLTGLFDPILPANITIFAQSDATADAPAPAPAPATLALLGLGLAGVGWSRRKIKR
jgi:hypothetical protein